MIHAARKHPMAATMRQAQGSSNPPAVSTAASASAVPLVVVVTGETSGGHHRYKRHLSLTTEFGDLGTPPVALEPSLLASSGVLAAEGVFAVAGAPAPPPDRDPLAPLAAPDCCKRARWYREPADTERMEDDDAFAGHSKRRDAAKHGCGDDDSQSHASSVLPQRTKPPWWQEPTDAAFPSTAPVHNNGDTDSMMEAANLFPEADTAAVVNHPYSGSSSLSSSTNEDDDTNHDGPPPEPHQWRLWSVRSSPVLRTADSNVSLSSTRTERSETVAVADRSVTARGGSGEDTAGRPPLSSSSVLLHPSNIHDELESLVADWSLWHIRSLRQPHSRSSQVHAARRTVLRAFQKSSSSLN